MRISLDPRYDPKEDAITRDILERVKLPYHRMLRERGYRAGKRLPSVQSMVLFKMEVFLEALRSL